MSVERLDSLIDSLVSLEISAEELGELTALVSAHEECAARFDHALGVERTVRRGALCVDRVAAGVGMRTADDGARRRVAARRRTSGALAASWILTAASLALAGVLAGVLAGRADVARVTLAADSVPPAVAGAAERSSAPGFIAELPLVPLGLRRGGSGEMEMVYVRPRVEQAAVSSLYRVAHDEHGRAVAVRAEVAPAGREAM